jgi:spore coat-associated protein N
MAAARSRLAIALAALGIAFAACLGGDHGAARAAVGNATGPLIGSPLAGAAILAASGMAPGEVRSGDIDITNIGDVSGTFALGTAGLSNTPLSRELGLDVRDITPGHTASVVYSGKLASLSSVALGDMAQGERHRYRFSVSLPSDADDSYQGASSTVTFLWSATAPEPTATPPAPTTPATPAAPATAIAPARATTAQSPPKATSAGGTGKSGATILAPARQRGTKVTATFACVAGCKIAVSGTAVVGSVKVKLKPVKRTLTKGKRLRVTVTLPPAARLALAAGRPVTVRLSVQVKVGTRVVTVRRTVRVMPASR